jgi:L-amino acid N-acyltransferase YncA
MASEPVTPAGSAVAEPEAGLPVRIEPMLPGDWPAVAAIYEQGIATRNATFETAVPAWRHWDAAHLPDHPGLRLVGRGADGTVLGWAALSPISDRCAYAGVAENSVYIADAARGRGLGRALLTELLARAEEAGFWTVQTGIFPENTASIALHEACGFRMVGIRERLGKLDGRWRDVVLLERRSAAID